MNFSNFYHISNHDIVTIQLVKSKKKSTLTYTYIDRERLEEDRDMKYTDKQKEKFTKEKKREKDVLSLSPFSTFNLGHKQTEK